MLFASVITLLSTTFILAVVDCFFKKHKTITFSLQVLTTISLFCTIFAFLHYKNKLDMFGLVLILSVLPQLLTHFHALKNEKMPSSNSINKITYQNPEKDKNWSFLLKCIGLFISSAILSICGLILGKETFYLYPLAIAIGLFVTFAACLKKKNVNLLTFFSWFFAFFAAGISLAQILTVLLYSTALPNILYCIAMLFYSVYAIISVTNFKYANLIYILSILTAISTVMFI